MSDQSTVHPLEYTTRPPQLPRVIWWLGVAGIIIGIERLVMGIALVWWFIDVGPYPVEWVLAGAELLLGTALLGSAAALLLRRDDAAWVILLVEKLYLITVAAWLVVSIGIKVRAGETPLAYADSEALLGTISFLSQTLLSAVYPLFAILLLGPWAEGEDDTAAPEVKAEA